MYLLAGWMFLFALAVFVWCLFASGRAARTPRRLELEHLEALICPATATWNAPADGNWQTANNWIWSDNTNDFPGNDTNRSDDVVFDNTSLKNCTLGANLAQTLNSLQLKSNYGKTVTLDGDVKVGQGGFKESAGTMSVGAFATLRLDQGSHTWEGGAIGGAGTLKVYEGTLTISNAASLMQAHMVIAGTEANLGVVYLGGVGGAAPMDGNLDLDGSGTIDVQNRGQLGLRQDVSDTDAFAKGGIVGGACSQITVSSGGLMTRGRSSNGMGGSVLVDVPVKIDGGTFQLFKQSAGTGELEKDVIKFGSAFASGDEAGYAVALTDRESKFIQDLSTDVIATYGVLVSASDATYQVTVGEDSEQSLTGNLTFTNDGQLKLLDAVNGVTGTFGITGNLYLESTMTTSLNWNATSADVIAVTNYAYLAGFLKVSGAGPAEANTSVIVVTDYHIVTPFGPGSWLGSTNTLSGYSTGPAYFIYWTAPEGGGGLG